jgi:hypothetical protein
MTQLLPIVYDNIDTLAASAFAKSRDCITAIREDVLHNVKPLDRVGFERLMSAMERRQIFTQDILVELDVQMDCITHLIDRGTTLHERFDSSESNVSAPSCWHEARQTQQAQDLGRAFIVLFDLHETLLAVHDLMHAETALSELRQAL